MKLKGHHFGAEHPHRTLLPGCMVLNTLIEHDFQDPFKKWRHLGTVHTRGQ
jgi:hypothetical protein